MEAEILDSELDKSTADLRKELLPKWIKVFGYIFIFGGIGALINFIFSLTFGTEGSYMILGLKSHGPAYSPMILVLHSIFWLNGICAYGLLFGKNWGLLACIIFGYVCLAISIGTTLVGPSIHLEPLVLIPYVIKLHKLRIYW
jgi:hypothetical protein